VPSPSIVARLTDRLGVHPEDLLGRRLDGSLAEAEVDAVILSARLGHPSAERELEDLLARAEASGHAETQSRILEALGLLEGERRHDERAIDLLERARAIDPAAAPPRERPALHRGLGRAYAGSGDLTKAVAILKAAFEDALRDPPDAALIAAFGTYLANAYTDCGEYPAAHAVLASVLQRESELAPGNVLQLEWALARTYVEHGQLRIAETYTRRVLARLEVTEQDQLVGQAHLLLGRILLDQNRLEEAEAHIDSSEPLLATAANVEVANVALDRARIHLLRGDLDRAQASAREALDRCEATEPSHAGRSYALLAEIELGRGNLDEARSLCREALALMAGTTAPPYIRQVCHTLATVEEQAGDLRAALAALRASPAELLGSSALPLAGPNAQRP
jgi:tetratricopeptide (TPR) repeat protein